MSDVHQRRRAGITLVEIVIVVIILGILAVIMIPQFVNTDGRNRSSGQRAPNLAQPE